MGSAEPAARIAKRLRKRVSLTSLLSAHGAITGSKANHGQNEEMDNADVSRSMNNIGLDLQLRSNRLHALPDALKEEVEGNYLWGVRVQYLLVVEIVFGAMIGVILGMATYDTRAYWWMVNLLLG
jgi:hypothetical protein